MATETVKKTNLIGKGQAGPGRPPGVPNKNSGMLKDAILEAARMTGNPLDENDPDGLVKYLATQARENPGPFLALVGKVLPMTVAGDSDHPLTVHIITGVPRNGDA